MLNVPFNIHQGQRSYPDISILLLEEGLVARVNQPSRTRPLTVTSNGTKYPTEETNTLLRSRAVRRVNWESLSCPLTLRRNSTIWSTIVPSKLWIINSDYNRSVMYPLSNDDTPRYDASVRCYDAITSSHHHRIIAHVGTITKLRLYNDDAIVCLLGIQEWITMMFKMMKPVLVAYRLRYRLPAISNFTYHIDCVIYYEFRFALQLNPVS